MKIYLKTFIISLGAGFLGAYVLFWLQIDKYSSENRYVSSPLPLYMRQANLPLGTGDFVEASALSTPSVVYIKTVSSQSKQSVDLFDYFFNDGARRGKVLSAGSGVIFTNDGYIVTNNHVIENAEKIEVIHNKSSYEATIVGLDPSTDLALLKIEAKNLPNIKLGRSNNVKVGEWVLAVGNPFNLTSTVTAGIVSAKGRNINILSSQFPIESFIQTDAAINPGNSGGALVNVKGELIGVNTAILSQTGSYTGYGFAVPVDIVAKVVNDIIKHGEVQKAFLGIEVKDLNSKIASDYNLKSLEGVIITNITKSSTAQKAGLAIGDVIIKINGEFINSRSDFDEVLAHYNPGDKIDIIYKRQEQIKETTILLTNREGTTSILKREIIAAKTLGADLELISKVERDKLGITQGIRINKITGGLFERLGLEEGFIITAINSKPIKTSDELISTLENATGRVIIEGISSEGVKGYYSFYF